MAGPGQAPRNGGNNPVLRPEALWLLPQPQTGRLTQTATMATAGAQRAAPPKCERLAIKPVGRGVRGIDQRPALFERPPLKIDIVVGWFLAPWRHRPCPH